ncbi:MAG: mechanosensitive ion channel family protein [Bacteroidales bacterium]|nr:mechanosensitive ion channel family protein [Bacteroidales bacterium]
MIKSMTMNFDFGLILKEWFLSLGLSENLASVLKSTIIILQTGLLAYAAYWITNRILFRVIQNLVKRTKYQWDDIIFHPRVFKRIAQIIPAIIILVLSKAENIQEFSAPWIYKAVHIYMIFIGLLVLDALINSLQILYQTLPISKEHPIKGYIQSIKIIIYAVGIIFILSVILGKSPSILFASLGALATVLLLVFKDTILGFVSGIQLSANQMVKPGDWITMPSKNADGTVLEISLNTVKVQNFDKTIVTIPTYALMSESFQNWKGMEESGGRRIARSIFIDLKSVKFCNAEMLDKFKKIRLIREYIEEKQADIDKHNLELGLELTDLANRRSLTNVGVFRKYIELYLESHPKIHNLESNYTLLVRHLQPTENGLPIQIYAFSRKQEWAAYEQIQADIFDHIFAILSEFELRVFQNPTGDDFKNLLSSSV